MDEVAGSQVFAFLTFQVEPTKLPIWWSQRARENGDPIIFRTPAAGPSGPQSREWLVSIFPATLGQPTGNSCDSMLNILGARSSDFIAIPFSKVRSLFTGENFPDTARTLLALMVNERVDDFFNGREMAQALRSLIQKETASVKVM